jgi:hypothetical protein
MNSMPVNHPIPFGKVYFYKSCATRATRASAGIGLVGRTVRGTQQPTSGTIKKMVRLVIHLHRHMGATVQVSMYLSLITDSKSSTCLPRVNNIKRHGTPPVDQVCTLTQWNHGLHEHTLLQACCSNQSCKSRTLCATWRGFNA